MLASALDWLRLFLLGHSTGLLHVHGNTAALLGSGMFSI